MVKDAPPRARVVFGGVGGTPVACFYVFSRSVQDPLLTPRKNQPSGWGKARERHDKGDGSGAAGLNSRRTHRDQRDNVSSSWNGAQSDSSSSGIPHRDPAPYSMVVLCNIPGPEESDCASAVMTSRHHAGDGEFFGFI